MFLIQFTIFIMDDGWKRFRLFFFLLQIEKKTPTQVEKRQPERMGRNGEKKKHPNMRQVRKVILNLNRRKNTYLHIWMYTCSNISPYPWPMTKFLAWTTKHHRMTKPHYERMNKKNNDEVRKANHKKSHRIPFQYHQLSQNHLYISLSTECSNDT